MLGLYDILCSAAYSDLTFLLANQLKAMYKL